MNRWECRMTAEGKRTYRGKWTAGTGTVIGETFDRECWIVQWDGSKVANQYEKRFIERSGK